MNLGDLIYSIITLVLIVLVMTSPLLKKIFKSAEKNLKGEEGELSSEERIYESVDSHRVVNRILDDVAPVPPMEFTEPQNLHYQSAFGKSSLDKKKNSFDRIDRLPSLKKAVIWKEILDKPKAF